MAMFSLLLVAALVASSLSAPSRDYVDYPRYECQDGFNLVEQTCFHVSDTSGTWHEGQTYCNELGASLATISSANQQNSVTDMLSESAWIGLNDLHEDHSYGWADGSEYNYKSWADGEPNNSGNILWIFGEREDCVEMRQEEGFLWNDEHCDEEKQYVCSTPADVITTTTTTTTTTTPAPECEEGWVMFELSCYQVSDTEAVWEEAQTLCGDQSAYLASINTQEEQDFLAGMLQQSTWIGLNDVEKTGNYTWVDGSDVTYTNWHEGEPNNFYSIGSFGLSEDCVEMRQDFDFEWNDKLCNAWNTYICEKPPQ